MGRFPRLTPVRLSPQVPDHMTVSWAMGHGGFWIDWAEPSCYDPDFQGPLLFFSLVPSILSTCSHTHVLLLPPFPVCYRLPHMTVFWTKDRLHLQGILYEGFYTSNNMYVPFRVVSENIPCHHVPLTISSCTPSAESVFWWWNHCSISSDETMWWMRTAFWQQCKHLNSRWTHCSIMGHLAGERHQDSSFTCNLIFVHYLAPSYIRTTS